MSVGMAVGPIVSGGISDVLSVDAVFYFGAIMGGTSTGLFVWFTRDYQGGQ